MGTVDLERKVHSTATASKGLLPFIDALNAQSIVTIPTFSKAGRMISLRFSPVGEATFVTAGAAGINQMLQTGPIYFSQSFHAPVLQVLAERHREGKSQPTILDAAGEVRIAHDRAAGPDTASLRFSLVIAVAGRDPAAHQQLFPILDHWSPMGREALLAAVREEHEAEDALQAIGDMPEAFGNAALRWIKRGLTPDVALVHTQMLMGDVASEPEETPQP